MGWGELMAWVETMNRQLAGEKTEPDSWQGHENDPGWAELRRRREQAR